MLMYSGKGRFAAKETDLNELVRALRADAAQTLPATIRLQCQLAEGLPPIQADSVQIMQLLSNLTTNAIEAIGGEGACGCVTISTGLVRADQAFLKECYLGPHLPNGDYAFVEVADTGGGMDAATQARIFDPFFSTKFTGRGLGLPTVSGIVRGHKGAIKVRSQAGAGSSFTVFLPACEKAAAQSSDGCSAATGSAHAGRQIMVVDDEEGVRNLTQMLLEQLGYVVVTAADGREALSLLRRTNGQMAGVVLDMTMPGMDGEETLRHMRQIRSDIPVVLMTGYSEESMIAKFTGVGGVAFLAKPFKAAELNGKLSALLK
jgi:CheY-like chemotaxis protein